jgi:hypothetical protein
MPFMRHPPAVSNSNASQGDTSAEARRVQDDFYSRLGGAGRLKLALQMSDEVREITLSRLRRDHPQLPQSEIIRKLVRLCYGIDLPREPLP